MKRLLTILSLILLAAGIALILWALFGPEVAANPTALISTEKDTLNSLLTFGGAMLVSAIVFLTILARIG